MPAMKLPLTTESCCFDRVGVASAANNGWFHSRLKPLPQIYFLPPFIAGMARSNNNTQPARLLSVLPDGLFLFLFNRVRQILQTQ